MNELTWDGCYDSQWSDLITPDSFAHPAKYSRGLIERIYDHMLARGYIRKGEMVLDPFGGIATGGVVAASKGLSWLGCELEPRFAAMAEANFALHRRTWELCGDPLPRIICGDSRRLRENLKTLAGGLVSSPPFQSSVGSTDAEFRAHGLGEGAGKWKQNRSPESVAKLTADYGTTAGQLASLPPGDVADAVVSSPPYNKPFSQDHNGSKGGTRGTTPSEPGAFVQYGTTPGQLEGMAMGEVAAVMKSPPYSEGLGHGGKPTTGGGHAGDTVLDAMQAGYGDTPGQLADMATGSVSAVVSSPPYAECLRGDGSSSETAAESQAKRLTPGGSLGQSCRSHGYGSDENLGNLPAGTVADAALRGEPRRPRRQQAPQIGAEIGMKLARAGRTCQDMNYEGQKDNIGNATGETFWSASKQIVSECYHILRPGSYAVWVCKNFVRKKKIVPFSDDWQRLCESCGFVAVERIKAMLVREVPNPDMFGETQTRLKERKSFFKRLAEKKGSPRIDFEDIIVMRKPE